MKMRKSCATASLLLHTVRSEGCYTQVSASITSSICSSFIVDIGFQYVDCMACMYTVYVNIGGIRCVVADIVRVSSFVSVALQVPRFFYTTPR